MAASVAPTPSVKAAAMTKDILNDPMIHTEATDVVEEAVEDASLDPKTPETAADRLASEDVPYDSMIHTDTSDMMEEALEISSDCVLLADLAGVIKANGDDLVHDAITEAEDSIIRDVAASVMGVSVATDATVTSTRPTSMSSSSPPSPGLSQSAPACPRRAPMPAVPEHQEFDAWYAAQSRTPPVVPKDQPTVAKSSIIPPSRPNKRQASSSDPSKTKRSPPSTSSTTRIPLMPKAGMSSVNNSSAETVRQSRREK
ncbi:hypothetical protein V6N13_123218 [Hibiscus sabdariffa]|uniref:Uncharacterized protein n=2 Tax=Hibiscus sabdariffa TaxID=183260 RepID=A0ABR2B7C8_9ROSI